MPDLPVNSPDMMAFLKTEPPIHCDDIEAWVVCGTEPNVSEEPLSTNQESFNDILLQNPSMCFIRDSIIDRLGPISCDFVEIVRPDNDFEVERAPKFRSKKWFELKKSDFVSVKCWTDDHK